MRTSMGYCMFENTFLTFKECSERMDDNELSDTENKYKELLLTLIRDIAIDYCDLVEEEDSYETDNPLE